MTRIYSSFVRSVGCCLALITWMIGMSPSAAGANSEQTPNILWITAEDMSATLGCYGDAFATTPNIDRLARESSRYTHAFATSPVCSPSRSCLINGCIATKLGTHPMRSLSPIPASMLGFPSLLRKAGYFTTNNVKTDYNTSSEPQIIAASWDTNGPEASWNLRSQSDQPFFAVHNLMTSHQSRTMVWPYEQFESEVQQRLTSDEIHDPAVVPLPPYYPDTELVRRTVARYYDCVTAMDKEVGAILSRLEADGLAENTIVFFYSDHGSGMPRHKRALFDTGTHVPMLIRFPKKYQHFAPSPPGETVDQMVSFEDFAPTVLRLAGIDTQPHTMRGKPFLGSRDDESERDYVFCHRDRVDEVLDMARSIRSKRYLYIRNFMPHRGYHQPSAWVDQGKLKDDFYAMAEAGTANTAQQQFLGKTRPREELYDCESDPLNLHNLAASESHQTILVDLRKRLHRELIQSKDLGLVPEIELQRRSAGSTPWQVAESGGFDFARLLRAAELVGTVDFDAIDRALADADPSIRYWGAVACTAISDSDGTELPERLKSRLRQLLEDESAVVCIEAAGALASDGGDQAGNDRLLELIKDQDETTVLHAARTLELLADPSVHDEIEALANKYEEAPGDVAWCIRFTTSAYLRRVGD